MNTNRRHFLATAAVSAAGATLLSSSVSSLARAEDQSSPTSDSKESAKPLADSAPSLQIPSAASIGVVWAVNGPASGWVEFSTREDFSESQRVATGVDGVPLNNFDDRFISGDKVLLSYRDVSRRLSERLQGYLRRADCL